MANSYTTPNEVRKTVPTIRDRDASQGIVSTIGIVRAETPTRAIFVTTHVDDDDDMVCNRSIVVDRVTDLIHSCGVDVIPCSDFTNSDDVTLSGVSLNVVGIRHSTVIKHVSISIPFSTCVVVRNSTLVADPMVESVRSTYEAGGVQQGYNFLTVIIVVFGDAVNDLSTQAMDITKVIVSHSV